MSFLKYNTNEDAHIETVEVPEPEEKDSAEDSGKNDDEQ